MPPAKRRKTNRAEMKAKNESSERKPLPVTILSGFLVRFFSKKLYPTYNHRVVERQHFFDIFSSHRTMGYVLPSS